MPKHIKSLILKNKQELHLVQGDITEEEVDAIVNAANSYLQHGGGVAGAIVRKGGNIIQSESNKIGYVPVGNAAITSAGSLEADYIIHAVGPRYGEGDEDEKLKNAVLNSLGVAEDYRIKSLSFPAISSGIFGFPKDRCAKIMVHAIIDYFTSQPDSWIKKVHICIYDDKTLDYFQKEFKKAEEEIHA